MGLNPLSGRRALDTEQRLESQRMHIAHLTADIHVLFKDLVSGIVASLVASVLFVIIALLANMPTYQFYATTIFLIGGLLGLALASIIAYFKVQRARSYVEEFGG